MGIVLMMFISVISFAAADHIHPMHLTDDTWLLWFIGYTGGVVAININLVSK